MLYLYYNNLNLIFKGYVLSSLTTMAHLYKTKQNFNIYSKRLIYNCMPWCYAAYYFSEISHIFSLDHGF